MWRSLQDCNAFKVFETCNNSISGYKWVGLEYGYKWFLFCSNQVRKVACACVNPPSLKKKIKDFETNEEVKGRTHLYWGINCVSRNDQVLLSVSVTKSSNPERRFTPSNDWHVLIKLFKTYRNLFVEIFVGSEETVFP